MADDQVQVEGSGMYARPDQILPMEEVKKLTIVRALRICNGNVRETAKQLEIGEATLYRKIKEYGIRIHREVTTTRVVRASIG